MSKGIRTMGRVIEYGVEVYASDVGNVCIKQVPTTGEENVIILHPDDIPQFIEYLQEVEQEALHIRHDSTRSSEGITSALHWTPGRRSVSISKRHWPGASESEC